MLTHAPTATSVAPGSKVTPGTSNLSAWVTSPVPAGRALWSVSVTASPWLTSRTGPGRLAVAVAQSPAVAGLPKPQIGTGFPVSPGRVTVPALAHNSMGTAAAEAVELASGSPAAATTSTSSALV